MSETIDIYSPLNRHPQMGDSRYKHVATWIPRSDQRRLTAYDILSRYLVNRAATLRTQPAARDHLREYGDAELLASTTRNLVLGETQTLRCDNTDALTWFEAWAIKERLTQKLITLEKDAVELGDGVVTLGWSAEKNRPILRTHNPAFYFPEMDDPDEEFPSSVAIAYEWESTDGVKWIRRFRWAILPLDAPRGLAYGGTTNVTCVYTAEDIRLEDLITGRDVHSKTMSRTQHSLLRNAQGESVEFVDMMIDFIPVVHVPNTPSTEELFGRSILLNAIQALYDLHSTDTDMNQASENAVPALITENETGDLEGGPGAMWAGTGDTKFLDTSKNLVAIQSHDQVLRDRIGEVTRVSKVLLGQVAPNDVPSGYALELGFHPSANLMQELREVRLEKYPLILKFAYRLAQVNGERGQGETPYAYIELGAALPADKPAAISYVKDMRAAKAMSTLTAVQTLQAAGFPVEDAEAEVGRIKQEWFEEAYNLVRATGDPATARTLLGIPEPQVRIVPLEEPVE